MLHNLKGQIGRELFNRRCEGVLAAPPARIVAASEVLVLSQLQHKDLLMYLVALKSFAARIPVGAVRLVDDGSLTPEDHELLARHVPGLRITPLTAHRSPRCPQGGTWERLLAIAGHASERYVIQLDADTVTLDDLPEVAAAIAAGESFSIGTWDGQRIEALGERAADARRLNTGPGPDHVQVAAEKVFDRVPGWERLRYVRGCSGFAGFARGAVTAGFIETFSQAIAAELGERWSAWGSEQVMSNVVVANSPRATVLPHPKYCDCLHRRPESVFVHFIGDCRFSGSAYRDAGAAQVERLARGAG